MSYFKSETVDTTVGAMDHMRNAQRGIVMGAWPRKIGYVVVLAFSVIATSAVWAEQNSVIPDAGEVEQEARLSPTQQIAWAEQQEGNIQRTARRVQRMLDQARQERDLIRITCLNDKLTQLNANLESFQSRREQHAEAVRANSDRVEHHYRIMAILAERGRSLRSEADACVGGEDVSFGATEVTTEIDPTITDDDATEWEIGDGEFVRPPSASGYY